MIVQPASHDDTYREQISKVTAHLVSWGRAPLDELLFVAWPITVYVSPPPFQDIQGMFGDLNAVAKNTGTFCNMHNLWRPCCFMYSLIQTESINQWITSSIMCMKFMLAENCTSATNMSLPRHICSMLVYARANTSFLHYPWLYRCIHASHHTKFHIHVYNNCSATTL